ncbi:MAG: DUF1292 domain-containing protein [Clostridia bacterium]|nr:DUF1292 domain-containing protein [Clostridia bacterium]
MTDIEKNVPEMEDNIIELTDENGETTQFEYLATIEHEDKLYVALMLLEGAADEASEDEGEVLILEIAKDENGEDVYVSVEDDAVSEQVFNKFLAMMDEEEDAE